jgi:hypothetical protein
MSQNAAQRLIYVLSPAKTLDLTLSTVQKCTEPKLLKDAHQLVCISFTPSVSSEF